MIEELKKVELHLHLDGSVLVETAEELLNENNLDNLMKTTDEVTNLTDYLKKFDIPIKIMQTKDNLIRISNEIIKQLKEDNVIYAEIRFAPNFHTTILTLEEVVDSILKGLKDNSIKTNLILCMMRGSSFEDNKKIIDLANKYLNKGVCAIDLAGDEIKYPTYMYEDLFKYADELNIPYTIHAGEAGTINDLDDAIKLNPKRIGHGIKAINNEKIINKLINNNITLEICPTSNVQTHNVDKYINHPIKKLRDKGVLLTINTDNRTVSNITLNEEYRLLQNNFSFTNKDFEEFNINAINSSFLKEEEKQELLYKLLK